MKKKAHDPTQLSKRSLPSLPKKPERIPSSPLRRAILPRKRSSFPSPDRHPLAKFRRRVLESASMPCVKRLLSALLPKKADTLSAHSKILLSRIKNPYILSKIRVLCRGFRYTYFVISAFQPHPYNLFKLYHSQIGFTSSSIFKVFYTISR